jgi:hypothetical protein
MQLDEVTQCVPCFKVYSDAWVMFGIGAFYLLLIMGVSKFKNSKREQIKFYDELNEIEKNYFSRLTKSEKNKWIALEHYRRTHLGVQLLKDDVFERLKTTNGRDYRSTNDPANYDILANQNYINQF